MTLRLGQSNFSKGEIGEELHGRFDIPTYGAGLKQARNVVIEKYGGVSKRPGTRIVAEVFNADEPVRLFPFQHSLENAYALEFGQAYMRPLAIGGLVLEEDLDITAITKALNAQITSPFHGYAVDDQVFYTGITGMTQMNGRVGRILSVVDDSNYTVDIDSTAFSTFVAATGTVRVGAPPAPPAPPVVPPPAPPAEPPPTYNEGGYYDNQGVYYPPFDWENYNWGYGW